MFFSGPLRGGGAIASIAAGMDAPLMLRGVCVCVRACVRACACVCVTAVLKLLKLARSVRALLDTVMQ